VGFDINCGVRLIRTNLTEQDVASYKEQIAEGLYRAIPVGVGSGGSVKCQLDQLDQILVSSVHLFALVPLRTLRNFNSLGQWT
jgi:tRNA-splicing ligase RtcB